MIYFRFLFLILFLLAATINTDARQVNAEIIGNEEIFSPPDNIARELLSNVSESEIASRASRWLSNIGYLDVKTDSVEIAGEQLQIYVNEGCRYRIDNVQIEEVGSEEESNLSAPVSSSTEIGSVFTAEIVQQISARWLSAFEEEGYYLSEFLVKEIRKDPESCTISISAEITAGEQLIVRGTRFEGLKRNDSGYLERITGIREGEVISPGLLERGQRNLINSGLFDDVSAGELIFIEDEPFVLYRVEEQQLNFFDGLVGYIPDATGSGNIAGYGDILLRNAIAEGNLLELRYEQLQPLVSKLNLRAEQHYIGGLPVRAGGAINFTQQDTSYLVRNIELNSGYRLLFTGFEITGHIRAERSSVSEPENGLGLQALNSRANFYGLGFNLRKTNRFRIPTRGYESRVMFERGRRYINDERYVDDDQLSFTQSILRADLRVYIPVGSRQVLAPRINGMFLESKEYLVTDLFRFGGAESLRGFREDQFRASSVVWGELEGRYLLDRNSYLFIFGAYGIYNRPKLINESTDQFAISENLTSLGFGLAFQSPLGIIKFSYAISPDDDPGNGKVHVGITAGL